MVENWQFCAPAEVAAACKQLIPFKKDSDILLNSSALVKALVNFFDLLCDLFNTIILQDYVQSSWKTDTLIPVLKSGNPNKTFYPLIYPLGLFCLVFLAKFLMMFFTIVFCKFIYIRLSVWF